MKGACEKAPCKDDPVCQKAEEKKTTNSTTGTTETTPKPEGLESSFSKIFATLEKSEEKALKQTVELVEKDFKGFREKTEKSLEHLQNEMSKIETVLNTKKKTLADELTKRDKLMSMMVGEKILPYIVSLIKRMDKMDAKMKKMKKEDDYFKEEAWKAGLN